MLVYGVFNSKEAAERAVKQITQVIPRVKVKRFSSTREAEQPGGTAGINFSYNPTFMPYPASFVNAWSAQDAVDRSSIRDGGRTALRVQVPDKSAADRAVTLMRQAGGAGVRQVQ